MTDARRGTGIVVSQGRQEAAHLVNIVQVVMGSGLFLAHGARDRVGRLVQKLEHDLVCLAVAHGQEKVDLRARRHVLIPRQALDV